MRRQHLWLVPALSLVATGGLASGAPVVGSPNTATADPPVARPNTEPCVVQLFDDLAFADFSPKPFVYTPPADCPGPWAKVVFEADFSVTAGRQFDRTANIWIGGTNVYFGTTAEPSRTVSPSWHVERDLTDYGALLESGQPGQVNLDNLVDSTFTGVISGSATLQFYPLERHAQAPRIADVVLPLSAGPDGGTVSLETTADTLARTFTLPTNVERAVLDVNAQSQAGDEFWYTCVPDEFASELQSCSGTAFRETQITIDGEPAGVAPIYPWIYTGGIDPLLWRPIPGVQTLEFVPYRVDLTPFAGILSDGRTHEVAVSVFNANHHFAVTASLLLYLDRGAEQVTGDVTRNTLAAAPEPNVQTDVTTAADGTISGTVSVTSARRFTIAGFVRTSHGTVQTEIDDSVHFANRQAFNITASQYVQDISQKTTIATVVRTHGRGRDAESVSQRQWPLDVHFAFVVNADQSSAQTTTIHQADERIAFSHDGRAVLFSVLANAVAPSDTLNFDAGGNLTSATGQVGSQRYFSADSDGHCYSRALTAAAGLLTAVVDGQGCRHH